MSASVGDSYREGEILTAPPQKLHLLLIEGAIRFVERTRHLWHENQTDAAFESLCRAQEIVAEILSGIKLESDFPLARKVAAIYTFIYRALVQAGLTRDEKHLEAALRVLHEEQQTWQELCRRLGGTSPAGDDVRLSSDNSDNPSTAEAQDKKNHPAGWPAESSGEIGPGERPSPASSSDFRSQPAGPHARPPLTESGSASYPQEYATGFSWEA